MSHIVESCPLTKLNGGLFRLHEDDVSWLTSYGSCVLCVLKVLGKVKQRAKFQHHISMHHAVMSICS